MSQRQEIHFKHTSYSVKLLILPYHYQFSLLCHNEPVNPSSDPSKPPEEHDPPALGNDSNPHTPKLLGVSPPYPAGIPLRSLCRGRPSKPPTGSGIIIWEPGSKGHRWERLCASGDEVSVAREKKTTEG